jgi:hypothetical protein
MECARLVGRSKTIKNSFGTVQYAVKDEGEPTLMAYGVGRGAQSQPAGVFAPR